MIPSSVLAQYDTVGCNRDFDAPEEGSVAILNCGKGDIRISFEKGNKADIEIAKQAVTEMLAAGYTIVVETDDGYKPVKKFDARRTEYIVQSTGPKGKRTEKRVKATKAKATAIAPRAGG